MSSDSPEGSLKDAESADLHDGVDSLESSALEDEPVRRLSGVLDKSVADGVDRALQETEVITKPTETCRLGWAPG